jgi:PAS domain S-box-containing protein
MSAAAPATAGHIKPPSESPSEPVWQVITLTALAYAVVGWLALMLALPPGYASPLYPSAGIALAAALTYGRKALPGVALGSFLVNVVLSASRGQFDAAALVLPAAIGIGAMLQAAAGAALVRRFVTRPLRLDAPRDIARTWVLGALLACLVNATLATLALRASGAIETAQISPTWGTWWIGDTLGVLIGAPLALTVIGRPRADWAPRRRTVALPLLLMTLLLGAGTVFVGRWDEERNRRTFAHDAEQIERETEARLQKPLYVLQALHSADLASGGLDAAGLRAAGRWWLAQPLELQAVGFSARVPRNALQAFEARVQGEGAAGYRVFEREGREAAAADADAVVLRWIEPMAGNAGAIGVNVLSIPAARAAVLGTMASGEPAVSAPFKLTQSLGGEGAGFVAYQAVYEGRPASAAARQAQFRGVLFVTVRAERLLHGLAGPDRAYLRWCLVDRSAASARLAGAPGCERQPEAGALLERRHRIAYAAREFELRVSASPRAVPGAMEGNAWPFSVVGLLAASLLGALLLTVTGRARRIALAVDERTAELRREVLDRSHAEHALRESEARLRSILENVPIGVMFLDLQGRIVETNPRLADMLGRPSSVLLRSSLADITHPDETAENTRQLGDLLAGRAEISRRQMRMLRGNGQELWVRAHLSVLRDEHGVPVRVAGVVEDISEHLRLEESERALDRAEAASRAKSEFVSRMSHELRTPLNAMIGFSQLLGLDRDPPLAPHQREWTQQILRAGWHLLEMINETLDLARIESGAVELQLRPLEIAPSLAASLAMVAQAATPRGIRLQQALGDEAAAVVADETRFKQILTNLLSNAVKYNRDGGAVVVETRRAPDGMVEIAVRDTGLGMTPEQMSSLFQPYNRLGREGSTIEGTGIGLVISRRLAEVMGGTLAASSVAGQGSEFTLRLPHAESPGPSTMAAGIDAPAPYRQRLVHYVEDNETNIEVMRGILLQRPQVALEVSIYGLDALTNIRRQRPDLILLDMQLPDISGLELLRHMKQDDDIADIPVIVVSADATTARMQEALTLGAAHYLTKPVDIQIFLKTLDELLNTVDTRWGL